MKAKRAFVPDALATLEDRAVPAPAFIGGVPVLTRAAYTSVITAIDTSFHLYGSNFNVNALASNLVRSVGPIPYSHFSGLDTQMVNIAFQTRTNVITGVPFPLVTQENAAIAAVNNLVAYGVATGTIIVI
jgi:hypothetical protein